MNKYLFIFFETISCASRILIYMLACSWVTHDIFINMPIFTKIIFIVLSYVFIFYDFLKNIIPIIEQFYEGEKNG